MQSITIACYVLVAALMFLFILSLGCVYQNLVSVRLLLQNYVYHVKIIVVSEKQAKRFEKLLGRKNIQIAMLPIYYTNYTEPFAFLEEDLRCLIAFSLMGKNHRFINSGCAIEARQFKFINNQWHKRLQLTKINTIISETRKLWDKNKLGY